MRRCLQLLLVGLLMLGGILSLQSRAQALEPLSPEVQRHSVRSRIFVWSGHRDVHPPVVLYPSPYGYIDPYGYSDPYGINRPPAPTSYGYLRLEVKPSEAEIYVDGSFIGRGQDFTGPAEVSVLAGGHVVEFRWQQFGSQVRLFVAEGETINIQKNLGPVDPGASVPSSKRWSTPSRRQGY